MPDPTLVPEVTIWTDASRGAVTGQVMDLMGSAVRPIGVGGPRVAEVNDLSRKLECPAEDDLRKMLVDRPAAFVLLATLDRVKREDIATALSQGSIVLTFEPVVATFDDLSPTGKARPGAGPTGRVVRLPSFKRSPGWTSAADPADVLGPVRSMSFATFGRRENASLYARLYDAWAVTLSYGDMPETITAAITGSIVPDTDDLRRLTGHLAVAARLPSGACALVHASDRGGQHERQLHVLGETGRLRVADTDYDLYDADGRRVDHKQLKPRTPHFADLVVAHWRQLADRPALAMAGPSDAEDAAVLACCHACLLSCRTAQPESPKRILEMHRR